MLSETLLPVVSFFDYATLVVLRLTNKQMISFVDRYAEKLAFRRTFNVSYRRLYQGQLRQEFTLKEVNADSSYAVVHSVDLDRTDNERIADAVAELQSHIGPHAVHELHFYELDFSVKLLVYLVPALRHASEIHLHYA